MRSGKRWRNASRSDRSRSPIATFFLLLALACAVPAPAQITELPREDSTAGDYFGAAVAIDRDHVIVGATGVDTCGPNSGAAYIYDRGSGESWYQSAELTASDCEAGIFFGRSVDLSGRFAAVAASREFFSEEAPNAVYVFERDSADGTWHEVAKLTGGSEAEEGAFATSLSMDGGRILVTTSGDPSGGAFGGAAYIFERDDSTGTWQRSARLRANPDAEFGVFGASGALQDSLVAVAASTYFRDRPGTIYIFRLRDDGWHLEDRVGEVQDFFISIDVDGGRVLVGESKAMRDASGSATLFEWDSAIGWHAAHVLRPQKPYGAGAFGSEVALDGDHALVVGFDEQLGLDFNIDRVVFVFRHDAANSSWRQVHVIDVGEVAFGADLDLDGQFAAVGRASEQEPGAVYIVRLPENGW